MGADKPGLALVGAGYWGKNLVRNFHALGALKAVCESDATRHADLQKLAPGVTMTGSWPQILSDASINAVAISTPAEMHAAMVRQALEAGKDVFVEKPLCLSAGDGESLVKVAEEKNRILMVGHILWYHPAVLKLKSLVDSGELGKIRYIYSNRLSLGKVRREENILWSFAPHDISVILGLLGEMPDDIRMQGGNYLHKDIADVTVSLLSFPGGTKAHIFVSWLHPFKEQKLVVVGEKCMAVFNDTEPKDKLVLYPHGVDIGDTATTVRKAEGKPVELEPGEPLRAECAHFLDCVKTRSKPRTDGGEGLRVLRVLQRCQEAL
jgi:UDP-2-acetamido-3-amino-2,3-dideoxy-glucuronate N-acetyltransferase